MSKASNNWHDAVLKLRRSIASLAPETPELHDPPANASIYQVKTKSGHRFVFRPVRSNGSHNSARSVVWQPNDQALEVSLDEVPLLEQLLDDALPIDFFFERKFSNLPIPVRYEARSWTTLMAALHPDEHSDTPPAEHPSVRAIRPIDDSWTSTRSQPFSLEDFNLLDPSPPVPELEPRTPHLEVRPPENVGTSGIAVDLSRVDEVRALDGTWLFTRHHSSGCKLTGDYRLWVWEDGIWEPQ